MIVFDIIGMGLVICFGLLVVGGLVWELIELILEHW